ncbi:MAG: PKD domain-containing protein [Vicinamibacterales bacterium]
MVSACDKVPLLAPSGSVITLFPAALSVPINGEIEIVATVIEQGVTATPPSGGTGGTTTTNQAGAGTPVHNGTLVSFTTTLGRIEPSEARTHNGQVRVKFIASGQSGLATITAFSGGASGKIENLAVGAAAAERITVSASPQNLPPSGGQTVISARVEDESGTGLAGIPVTFQTTTGSLSQTTAVTNSSGVATTTLTTSSAAEVTATAGSQSGKLTIGLAPRLISGFTASPQATSAGVPVTFTVTAGSTGNIADATIDFGDGSSQPLGSFSGQKSVSHPYSSPNIYTARVTARDSLGTTETQTTSVTIGTLPVTLIANPSRTSPNNPITFTVGGTSQAQVREYRWNFGDGTPITTSSGPQTSHAFSQRATYEVRVQVIGLDGNVIATGGPVSVVIEGL